MTISEWHPLPLGVENDLPPFLVKHEFKTSAYTVMLTDLTHIWTESLDRKKIIQRALREDASIDPSEGSDQFKLLLQNIREALDGRQYTSLSIKATNLASSVTLEVSAPLPHPLDPLRWQMNLSRNSEHILSTEFVIPCLTSLADSRSEVSSLLALIKDKDHVIGRMKDKLEAADIELAAVFPSAAPPKRSKAAAREAVLSSVRGLKDFNELKWRDARVLVVERDLRELCSEIFDSASSGMRHLDQDSYEKWLSNSGFNDSSGGVKQALACSEKSSFEQDGAENDFQKQVTSVDGGPQSLQETGMEAASHQEGLQPENKDNDSTTTASDDDLDLTRREVRNRPQSDHTKLGKKIGLLGGRHRVEVEAAQPLTNTAGSEREHEKDSSVLGLPDLSLTTDKPKNRLGKIGGRQKVDGTAHVTADNTIDSAPRNSSAKDQLSPRSGRTTVRAPVSAPPIRETSRERADRKRARLIQELEEKSKGPVKKKRKF